MGRQLVFKASYPNLEELIETLIEDGQELQALECWKRFIVGEIE